MIEYPNLTACSPEQVRAQMKHLFGLPAPEASKLETGGHGVAYVKVWRAKPLALILWFHFEPGTKGELWAYERAVQAMTDNPGAKWAVSVACGGECASLPVICDDREALSDLLMGSEVEMMAELLKSKKSLVCPEEDRPVLTRLAKFGYAYEVWPGTWEATKHGRKRIELDKKAARAEKLEEMAE